MATFSFSCTSTAAKEVAGWTGGGVWSVAAAGRASHTTRSGNPCKTRIAIDCIIWRVRPLDPAIRLAQAARMVIFFYNLALIAALVAGAPWWLWRMATTEKYREGIGERLGRLRPGLRGRPE